MIWANVLENTLKFVTGISSNVFQYAHFRNFMKSLSQFPLNLFQNSAKGNYFNQQLAFTKFSNTSHK